MAGKPPAKPNDKKPLPSLKDLIGTQDESEKQTGYLENIDDSFSQQIVAMESLERSINDQMSHEFDRLRMVLNTSFRWTKFFSLRYQALNFLSKRKERKLKEKEMQREDQLPYRQIVALSVVGERLSSDLGVIQKLLARKTMTGKSKEEQNEEQAFLRNLVGGIGDSISESLSKLKINFPEKKKSWLWMTIKGILLVAAAYVYRAWKVYIEPAIKWISGKLTKIKKIFTTGFIGRFFGRVQKFFSMIGNFFGRLKGPAMVVIGGIKNFFNKIAGLFKEGGPLAKVGTFFSGIFTTLKNSFSGGFLSIIARLKNFFRYVPIVGWIITIVEGIVGLVRGWFASEGQPLMTRIGMAIQGLFAQIISGLTFGLLSFDDVMGFFDKVSTALGDFFYSVYEFFTKKIPIIFTETIPNAGKKFAEIAKDFFLVTIPDLFNKLVNSILMAKNYTLMALYNFAESLGIGDYSEQKLQLERQNYVLSGQKEKDDAKMQEEREAERLLDAELDAASLRNMMAGVRSGNLQYDDENLKKYIDSQLKSPTLVGQPVLEELASFRRERFGTDMQAAAAATTVVQTNVTNNNVSSSMDSGENVDATDRPNSIYSYTPSYAY